MNSYIPGEFRMYHSTPVINLESILSGGLHPTIPPHLESPWSPSFPVVYFTSSISIARDYAKQAHDMDKFTGNDWAILEIRYSGYSFPAEPKQDLAWGLPGTYYVEIGIPKEHISLIEIFDTSKQHASAGILYHVTPTDNVISIMEDGLIAPVHMLTSKDRAVEWQIYAGVYEPMTILEITVPGDWIVNSDPMHPEGTAVVSEEDIPAKYIRRI